MSETAGRAEPRQKRALETRDALLLGAARVFARMSYSQARLKDIARASGVSEGALYFHFGSKSDVATAVIEAQQERMTAVLSSSMASASNGLEKLISAMRGLGELMARDEIVQAGISLTSEPSSEVAQVASDPYFEWIRIARTLLQLGLEDGSVAPGVDVARAAEFVNYSFVGAQVIAGMADRWASLPARLTVVERGTRALLAPLPAQRPAS